jgi:hypothetical protein
MGWSLMSAFGLRRASFWSLSTDGTSFQPDAIAFRLIGLAAAR